MFTNWLRFLVPVFVAIAPAVLTADEPPESTKVLEARKRQAAEHMKQLKVWDSNSPDKRPVGLIDPPLLAYGEPTRQNEIGTLWAFGDAGRPVVFVELFRAPPEPGKKSVWRHALTLTSPRTPVMATPIGTDWTPQKAQIEPTPFGEAPAPHETESVRLRQMKGLARRFSAHEFWDPNNSRFELRLLVQPVHRYSDPKGGLHDGAAFIIAHGTNPEVVLMVEALGDTLRQSRWHYSLARLSSAELHVQLDGKEVSRQDRTRGPLTKPTDPYWLFVSPADQDPDAK